MVAFAPKLWIPSKVSFRIASSLTRNSLIVLAYTACLEPYLSVHLYANVPFGLCCSPRIIRFVVFIDPHQGLIMLTDAVD